jgi:fructose/tagatose bisphosphate aldolase
MTVRHHPPFRIPGALAFAGPPGTVYLAPARPLEFNHAVYRPGHRRDTEAVELSIPSGMFDASALDYADNAAATADVSRWCHERGAWVEAELGKVGGKDGVHAPVLRTDLAQIAAFPPRPLAHCSVDMATLTYGNVNRSR